MKPHKDNAHKTRRSKKNFKSKANKAHQVASHSTGLKLAKALYEHEKAERK